MSENITWSSEQEAREHEHEDTEFQPVTVDYGDLLEVLKAAEAWADYLRSLTPSTRNWEQAADRIDKVIRSLQKENLTSQ